MSGAHDTTSADLRADLTDEEDAYVREVLDMAERRVAWLFAIRRMAATRDPRLCGLPDDAAAELRQIHLHDALANTVEWALQRMQLRHPTEAIARLRASLQSRPGSVQ